MSASDFQFSNKILHRYFLKKQTHSKTNSTQVWWGVNHHNTSQSYCCWETSPPGIAAHSVMW